MYLSRATVKQALSDLKGRANSLLKIWLTLKVMGLKNGTPVLVDTSNSSSALKRLFNSGANDGRFYVPFASSSGDAWMKSHASRSIVQTNIKKWYDGTVTTVDPRGYLTISKEGVKYKVDVSSTYPQGLGVGRNGFANATDLSLAVPIRQFAAWVFCRDAIPDTESDVGAYLCEKLRDLLNLDSTEEQCVFADVPFEFSTAPEALSESDIFNLCNGRAIQMVIQEYPRQWIRYGAPGTGKSFGIAEKVSGGVVFRTTFHPDSDYTTFVGAYKPTMNGGAIEYAFRPQSFMSAYVQAWKEMSKGVAGKPVVLVIEEINRGNCAQIFGDLFQLLDRDDTTGYSTYPIITDKDLAAWLKGADQFGAGGLGGVTKPDCIKQGDWDDILKGDKLALPPTLYIWATMNTSDQSLFPIDSAFKRRWDWQYVPISKPDTSDGFKDRKIVANGNAYDWWDFITIINAQVADVTKSEDKQLGYFFVKAPDATGHISAERFANKVLFYLFNDVFKDWDLPEKIFGTGAGKKCAFKDFFYGETTVVGGKTFMPGDVKEEAVAEFIEKQKDAAGKTVDKAPLNPPAPVPAPAT